MHGKNEVKSKKKKVKNLLDRSIKYSGNLNAWEKTIGTMKTCPPSQ